VMGNFFASMLASALAPPPDTTYQQQQLLQQKIAAEKKKAAMKKQAIEGWKKLKAQKEETITQLQEIQKKIQPKTEAN